MTRHLNISPLHRRDHARATTPRGTCTAAEGLDAETFRGFLLAGASGEVLASAWFEHDIADRYQIWEHSIRGFQDRVLSLLWWKTEKMLMDLDDYEERRAAKRWDDRD